MTQSRKPHRIPRKGFFYLLVRATGLLLKITGLLLLVVGVIGFIFMLVRIGPSALDSLRYLDQQKFAGFVFFMSLGYLVLFPIIGLVGVGLAGIGFVLGLAGTQSTASTQMIHPDIANQTEPPPTS
jgi:hypothetical protein